MEAFLLLNYLKASSFEVNHRQIFQSPRFLILWAVESGGDGLVGWVGGIGRSSRIGHWVHLCLEFFYGYNSWNLREKKKKKKRLNLSNMEIFFFPLSFPFLEVIENCSDKNS